MKIPTIENPCLKKCGLDEEEVCLGCFRTYDDMRAWNSSSDEEKEDILLKAKVCKEKKLEEYYADEGNSD